MISFRRLYHVSSTVFSLKKLGVKLNKMVNPKVKRQWYPTQLETDIMPSVKSLTKTQNEPGKRAIRRSSMLNKMFMKHITDMMSTGTVAIDVVGRGIEVSKAKIKQLEEDTPLIEEPLPEMTHNVFGLDHEKILNRLVASRKKSRDAWSRLDSPESTIISYRTTEDRKSD
ncbi:Uncharacterized protein OBRU01_25910, partial [Operophtera brumata]